MSFELLQKYDVAVPRYTSYPPVPAWAIPVMDESLWKAEIIDSYDGEKGLSLYIHLPYCEQLCTYCGCNKRITINHNVEMPYIHTVLKEWNSYIKIFGNRIPKIKELHLGGGTPTFFDPQNLKILIDGIFENAVRADDAALSFEAHPNSTTADHLEVLYNLGFRRISIGVQDLSPKIMKAINRNQTVEEITFVTNYARILGYDSVNYDLIYGLPFQTMDDIRVTMDYLAEMLPDRIAFYSYAHVPWKSAGQRAFEDQDVPQGFEKYQLKKYGTERLNSLGYQSIGMDHFALETDSLYQNFKAGLMHRNFMGYTDKKTSLLIGLGASSISETPTMYVQNEKHIEDYTTAIDKSGFALTKGHQLTKTQQNIRTHILRLMCTYQTEWSASMEDQIIKDICVDSMHELILDQLVVLQENKLAITEKGKDFIRNICAGIDFEFARPTQKVYSSAI